MKVATWPRFGRWPLSSRIVGLSLLLLLLVQAAGFLALRAGIEQNARARLADELVVGERVWLRLLDQRATKLGQGASLLAADYGFRAAVSSDDRDTIGSALENHGARIGARVAALLDTRLALRAQSLGEQPELSAQWLPQLAALAPRLVQQGSTVAVVAGKAYQFVMVPMKAPLVIGWVVMGFELDRAVVDDLHAVAGLHATLMAQPFGLPARLLHSSLPGAPQAASVVAWNGAAPDVLLAGAPHLLRTVPVSKAADSPVVLRLSGSVADAVAPYLALQLTMGVLTLIGLALFGLGSVWTARWVTRPLGTLVQASERLGRGDYDTPLRHTGRADEFGELAKAFEHMRLNIGHNQREIRQLAYWDRLTGLPNRAQFRDVVQAAVQTAAQAAAQVAGAPVQSLAVVMLDLDRFKHVNDVLGYAFGDRLLQGVAQRLQQALRPGDVVARLGGDEFALLLPQANAALAQAVAVRIATAFELPMALDEQRVDLSAGLGIACWPEHAADADSLLSRAEVAMYAAKQGKRGALLFESRMDSSSAQTLSLLSELRHAVEHDELRLFMQPKVGVASGQLCGVEALVRWQHPQRGLVPPNEFIPFAEQTGYVRQLTLWVFEAAAKQQAALLALGLQRVSINLSTRDLMDLELPDKLEVILLRHRARAEGFCLEITEGAIMDDAQRAKATLDRLSQRGYKLSIDDFGTGYSSLAYLQQLPVQELKIDMSFVKGMEKNPGDETIVRSTIELAHNLGLTVVAEGVENAAILQRLAELGCDEAQGYHLSRPVPLAALQQWAAQRSLMQTPALPLHRAPGVLEVPDGGRSAVGLPRSGEAALH